MGVSMTMASAEGPYVGARMAVEHEGVLLCQHCVCKDLLDDDCAESLLLLAASSRPLQRAANRAGYAVERSWWPPGAERAGRAALWCWDLKRVDSPAGLLPRRRSHCRLQDCRSTKMGTHTRKVRC